MKRNKRKILLSFGALATLTTASSVILSCGSTSNNHQSSWHDKILASTKSFANEAHAQNWANPDQLASEFVNLYNSLTQANSLDKTINQMMSFLISKDDDNWFKTQDGQNALAAFKQNFLEKTWIMAEASYLLTFLQSYGITYPISASDSKSIDLINTFILYVFDSQTQYMSPAADTRVILSGADTLITGMSFVFDPLDNALMNWSPLNVVATEEVEITSKTTEHDDTGHGVEGYWKMMNADNTFSNVFNAFAYQPSQIYTHKPVYTWDGFNYIQ